MADDYIKREDAVKALADMLAFEAEMDYCDTFTSDDFIDDAKGYFEDVPSADVAPVVRCGDCLFCQMELGEGADEPWCDVHRTTVGTENFCSWGKERQ